MLFSHARAPAVLLAIALTTAIGLVGCTGPPTEDDTVDVPDTTDFSMSFDRPVLDRASPQVRSFQVEYGCSRANPRTVVATLTWEAEEPVTRNRQRLDATVYKDGFESQRFVALGIGAPETGFLHARPETVMDTQPYRNTLSLRIDSLQVQPEAGAVRLRVAELNPQTNYFWRVLTLSDEGWRPSETIRKSSPTCVADMMEQ